MSDLAKLARDSTAICHLELTDQEIEQVCQLADRKRTSVAAMVTELVRLGLEEWYDFPDEVDDDSSS